jgi:hypothetical protein
MKLFLSNSRENNKSRKIGFTILGFSTIFYNCFGSGIKRKRKACNSIRPILTQVGPTTVKARPRWWLYRKALRVLANRKQVLLLFLCVADGLQKSPPVSMPLHDTSSTALTHSQAPASACTGRMGQRLGSLSD